MLEVDIVCILACCCRCSNKAVEALGAALADGGLCYDLHRYEDPGRTLQCICHGVNESEQERQKRCEK